MKINKVFYFAFALFSCKHYLHTQYNDGLATKWVLRADSSFAATTAGPVGQPTIQCGTLTKIGKKQYHFKSYYYISYSNRDEKTYRFDDTLTLTWKGNLISSRRRANGKKYIYYPNKYYDKYKDKFADRECPTELKKK